MGKWSRKAKKAFWARRQWTNMSLSEQKAKLKAMQVGRLLNGKKQEAREIAMESIPIKATAKRVVITIALEE